MGVNTIKLSTRIYFQQIMVVIALIGLGVYALNNLQHIHDSAVELADDDIPVLQLNMEVMEKIHAQEFEVLTYRYAGLLHVLAEENNKKAKWSDFELAKASYLNANKESEEAINNLEEKVNSLLSIEDDAEMIAMLKDFKVQFEKVKEGKTRVVAVAADIEKLVLAGDDAGLNKLLADIFDIYKKTDIEMNKLIDFSQSDIVRSIGYSEKISSDLVDMLYIIVITVSLLAITLTIITGFSLRTLRKSVDIISGSVQQVATAAAQSGNAISMVSDGAKRQSDSINQAVTAVEQSVSVLAEVSKSAEEATELAKNAGTVVRNGKEKMDVMVRVVNRIEENSNKINKITDIIAGIANQTNMLALNAAIEAARAGEQGKGFAVVADQVKNLAESSKSSVEDIVTLIEQAKADASEAVLVASNVNQEMEKIMESSKTTERMMQNISTAMEEQVSTTEELGQNMDTLRDIGTSNANAAEEITETIIELSRIASDTNQEIKKFNI